MGEDGSTQIQCRWIPRDFAATEQKLPDEEPRAEALSELLDKFQAETLRDLNLIPGWFVELAVGGRSFVYLDKPIEEQQVAGDS